MIHQWFDFPSLTCSDLSNQRLALFHWVPPPCKTCTGSNLLYFSYVRGMALSKHSTQMLLSMAETDFLLEGSEQIKHKDTQSKYAVKINLTQLFKFNTIV